MTKKIIKTKSFALTFYFTRYLFGPVHGAGYSVGLPLNDYYHDQDHGHNRDHVNDHDHDHEQGHDFDNDQDLLFTWNLFGPRHGAVDAPCLALREAGGEVVGKLWVAWKLNPLQSFLL